MNKDAHTPTHTVLFWHAELWTICSRYWAMIVSPFYMLDYDVSFQSTDTECYYIADTDSVCGL